MIDETTVVSSDSATRFEEAHRGHVVICGSHGGAYCGYLAAAAGLRAVILNDAGGGLDRAGLGCLDYCEQLGMAVATSAHDSARIGDGEDMAARGRISSFNKIATASGLEVACRSRRPPIASAQLHFCPGRFVLTVRPDRCWLPMSSSARSSVSIRWVS